MKLQQFVFAGLAVGVLGGATARADAMSSGNDRPFTLTDLGMSAEIGGGVLGFSGTGATDVTKTGADWTARLTLGTRSHIGFEAGYIGSAQGMSALGIQDTAYLVSHGIEGNIRYNVLTGMWQPYVLAGVGWRHYSIQNSSYNTSDIQNSDDVAEVPVGLGVAFRYRGLVLDVRGTFRNSFGGSLIPNSNLSAWEAGGRLGWEF